MRRWAALLLFAAIVILSVNRTILRYPFRDRATLHAAMTQFPDRGGWWPDYPQFLQHVRDRTEPGDAIALVVPVARNDNGYTYYRASYLLAGREVLPTRMPDGRTVPESLRRAKYIAVWRGRVPSTANVVFEGNGGVLVRR